MKLFELLRVLENECRITLTSAKSEKTMTTSVGNMKLMMGVTDYVSFDVVSVHPKSDGINVTIKEGYLWAE